MIINQRDIDRQRIAREIKEFQEAGGEIEKLPHWVGENRSMATKSERRAAARSAKKERPTSRGGRWHAPSGDKQSSRNWNSGV